MKTHSRKNTKVAFTLIEMLIVLTLGGILLTAATSLLVNLTILRSFPDSSLHFQLHSSNLQRFLESAINADTIPPTVEVAGITEPTENRTQESSNAETEPTQPATPISSSEQDDSTKWAWLPEESQSRPPHLEFSLSGELPLLQGTPEANRSVRAQLHFSEESGLFLVWYYASRENSSQDFEIYQRKLSPWVKALEYAYYDEEMESWDIEDSPTRELGTSEYPLPDYILLTLLDEDTGMENKLQILMPKAESEVPHP